jgi:hypothetical protein
MAKSKSDFCDDREWNTPPDADAPDDVKHRYQRELRRRWEGMGKPSDILDFPMPNGDWWRDPYGTDPQIHIQRAMKRLQREQRST